LKDELAVYNKKIVGLINNAWPAEKDLNEIGPNLFNTLGPEFQRAFTEYDSVKTHIAAFKKDVQKAQRQGKTS
jgi:hypothetical protein